METRPGLSSLLNRVHCMDVLKFLPMLPENSVHSSVTDPPYGLEFMNAEWDSLGKQERQDQKRSRRGFGYSVPSGPGTGRGTGPTDHTPAFDLSLRSLTHIQRWHTKWAKELFRVLRPGAHVLVFSGTRTYHRLACGLEDAGFIVRDQIHWVYGSGFPKGLNVSMAILQSQLDDWLQEHPDEKAMLDGLKTTDEKRAYRRGLLIQLDMARDIPLDEYPETWERSKEPKMDITGGGFHVNLDEDERAERRQAYFHRPVYPLTPEARQWYGWNTALKPAHEPIVIAFKPISEKTVVENVLKWGTGALNIDACRIPVSPDFDMIAKKTKRNKRTAPTWETGSGFTNEQNSMAGVLPNGRYPANLILSHHEDCQLISPGETELRTRVRVRTSPKLGGHGIYGRLQEEQDTAQDYRVVEPELWDCVDGCPVKLVNEQSGPRQGCQPHNITSNVEQYEGWGTITRRTGGLVGYPDAGGASRFFLTTRPEQYECVEGCPVRALNEQSGDKTGAFAPVNGDEAARQFHRKVFGKYGAHTGPFYGDLGFASRFFYCAKASRSERNAGLGHRLNTHITVKPLGIVRWLVRLVTPPGGIVIDPFLGSGTTAIAAGNEGFSWLGCDNNEEFCDIARARISALGGLQVRIEGGV